MNKLGLLGHNISYTLSPLVHGNIFAYLGIEGVFDVYDTAPAELTKTVERMKSELVGFNVTKPYKREIIRYLDEDDSGCGAVNTVAVRDGKAIGYNTDGYGFMMSFMESNPLHVGERVLVLGAGGAARVVVKELKAAGFDVCVHNRTAEKASLLQNEFGAKLWCGGEAAAVVNCTSFGFKAGENPLDGLTLDMRPKGCKYAYDLIYSPPETDFLKAAKAAGAITVCGLDMLIYQAIRSDELILGVSLGSSDYRAISENIKSIATMKKQR